MRVGREQLWATLRGSSCGFWSDLKPWKHTREHTWLKTGIKIQSMTEVLLVSLGVKEGPRLHPTPMGPSEPLHHTVCVLSIPQQAAPGWRGALEQGRDMEMENSFQLLSLHLHSRS